MRLSRYVLFHKNLYHSPTKKLYPAMVCIVVDLNTKEIKGIHRTYLIASGHKADIAPNKMMYGSCMGGGVIVTKGCKDILLVGEGIETTMSLAMFYSNITAIATLSASNMKKLELPKNKIRKLIIGADGDEVGIEAAQILKERMIKNGLEVDIKTAPLVNDWNDILIDMQNGRIPYDSPL